MSRQKQILIYEYLEGRRKVLSFGRFLVERGIYKSPYSYGTFAKRLYSNPSIQYGTGYKIKKMNELFEEWLHDNPRKVTYSEVTV